jgi:hypothetical protein
MDFRPEFRELANGSELGARANPSHYEAPDPCGPPPAIGLLPSPLSGLSFARHRPAVESRHFCQSPGSVQLLQAQ